MINPIPRTKQQEQKSSPPQKPTIDNMQRVRSDFKPNDGVGGVFWGKWKEKSDKKSANLKTVDRSAFALSATGVLGSIGLAGASTALIPLAATCFVVSGGMSVFFGLRNASGLNAGVEGCFNSKHLRDKLSYGTSKMADGALTGLCMATFALLAKIGITSLAFGAVGPAIAALSAPGVVSILGAGLVGGAMTPLFGKAGKQLKELFCGTQASDRINYEENSKVASQKSNPCLVPTNNKLLKSEKFIPEYNGYFYEKEGIGIKPTQKGGQCLIEFNQQTIEGLLNKDPKTLLPKLKEVFGDDNFNGYEDVGTTVDKTKGVIKDNGKEVFNRTTSIKEINKINNQAKKEQFDDSFSKLYTQAERIKKFEQLYSDGNGNSGLPSAEYKITAGFSLKVPLVTSEQMSDVMDTVGYPKQPVGAMILNEMLSKGMIQKNENGLVDPTSVLKLLNNKDHSKVVDALLNNPATSEATAKLFVGAAKTLHNQTGVLFGINNYQDNNKNIANIRHKLDDKIEQATQSNKRTDDVAQFFNLISDPTIKPQSSYKVSKGEYRTIKLAGEIVADIPKMSSQQINAFMSKIGDQVVSNNHRKSYQSVYQDKVDVLKKQDKNPNSKLNDKHIKQRAAQETIWQLMGDKYFSAGSKNDVGKTSYNGYHEGVFGRATGDTTHQEPSVFREYETALNEVVKLEKALAEKPGLLDIADNIPDINVNLGRSEQVSLREMFKAYPGAVLSVIAQSTSPRHSSAIRNIGDLKNSFSENKNPYTSSPLHDSIYKAIANATKNKRKQNGMLNCVSQLSTYTNSQECKDYVNGVKNSQQKLTEVHKTLKDRYGLSRDAIGSAMEGLYGKMGKKEPGTAHVAVAVDRNVKPQPNNIEGIAGERTISSIETKVTANDNQQPVQGGQAAGINLNKDAPKDDTIARQLEELVKAGMAMC
jgi:hypothetical protein